MKLAIITDIHSNYPALHSAARNIEKWKPDLVIVGGDTINRGPRPSECLDFVMNKCETDRWLIIRGNHEDYVINRYAQKTDPASPEAGIHCMAKWTLDQLNGDVSTIEALPTQLKLPSPVDGKIIITHASIRGNRDGIYSETPPETLADQIDPSSSLFCVGHTHRSFVQKLDNTLIVNAGSAGLPFDGNHKPAYAQLKHHRGKWQAKIVRFDYDRVQAEKDFNDTGFMDGSGPLAGLVFQEFKQAHSQLYQWGSKYLDEVLAGNISLDDSVEQFLLG